MAEYIDKETAIQICMDSWDATDAAQGIKEETPADVIEIPEDATNGDMFLKAHPEVVATTIKKEGYLFNCVQLRNKEETIPFAEVYVDWWNAPYKKEVEE